MPRACESWGLRPLSPHTLTLQEVEVQCEVLGSMLRTVVRQRWHNPGPQALDVQLRMPVAEGQVVLDALFESKGGTNRLMHLAWESPGICCTPMGPMAAGETGLLHWRTAQLLSLQDGRLHLELPAALVPQKAGGARITLRLLGAAALGTVSSPSHELQQVRHNQGLNLQMQSRQGLEQNLVVHIHGLRDAVMAVACAGKVPADPCTLLVSAGARIPSSPPRPLRLKLLVQHSPQVAVAAALGPTLTRLLANLGPQDQCSFSRLGQRVLHELPRLQPCNEAYLRRLRALLRQTPSLPEEGVGDVATALADVMALTDEDENPVNDADVLLITASALTAPAADLARLRASGHRLHVLVMNPEAAPGWRILAQASAGACECPVGLEQPAQALQRLLERMRHLHSRQPSLALSGADLVPPLPAARPLADSETQHLWLEAKSHLAATVPAGQAPWEVRLQWHAPCGPASPSCASAVLWDADQDLPRLRAGLESFWLDPECAQSLRQTQSLPLWLPKTEASEKPPTVLPLPARPSQTHSAPRFNDLGGWLLEPDRPGHPVHALVRAFNAQATDYVLFRAALGATLQALATPLFNPLVMQLSRRAGNPARVWAMVLHWLHAQHGHALSEHALTLIETELGSVPLGVRKETLASLALACQPGSGQQVA